MIQVYYLIFIGYKFSFSLLDGPESNGIVSLTPHKPQALWHILRQSLDSHPLCTHGMDHLEFQRVTKKKRKKNIFPWESNQGKWLLKTNQIK